jgi:hypothetical protein
MADWEFELEDLEEDEAEPRPALEPGTPTLENAAFVVLGVVVAVTVVVLLVG